VAHLDATSPRACVRARASTRRRPRGNHGGVRDVDATRCASRRGRRDDARDGRLDDDDEERRERLCVLARGTEPARGAAER